MWNCFLSLLWTVKLRAVLYFGLFSNKISNMYLGSLRFSIWCSQIVKNLQEEVDTLYYLQERIT